MPEQLLELNFAMHSFARLFFLHFFFVILSPPLRACIHCLIWDEKCNVWFCAGLYIGRTMEELVLFPNVIEAHPLCKVASWKWVFGAQFLIKGVA